MCHRPVESIYHAVKTDSVRPQAASMCTPVIGHGGLPITKYTIYQGQINSLIGMKLLVSEMTARYSAKYMTMYSCFTDLNCSSDTDDLDVIIQLISE